MTMKRRPDLRQYKYYYKFWRAFLCRRLGHRAVLMRPLVPNPYACESWIVACERCTVPLKRADA